MRLIIFSHPLFLPFYSIHRFAEALAAGMRNRGHEVELCRPKPMLARLSAGGFFGKVLGHVDQYLLFPTHIKQRCRKRDSETLFVFADNALGPWVPLVAGYPHVIHCHDFLAQQRALHPTTKMRVPLATRWLQQYVYNGYQHGKNFISVSGHTQSHLHAMLKQKATISEVTYNGLNRKFAQHDPQTARTRLGYLLGLNLSNGFLLHVGSDAWYKNRIGVVDIYDSWRNRYKQEIPLLFIGALPGIKLAERIAGSPYASAIHCFAGLSDEAVELAYSGAHLLLYPSIAEGFGWPIAEAMACGCPVITTQEAPMTEVGGDAAFYVPPMPPDHAAAALWALGAARQVAQIMEYSHSERSVMVQRCLANARRFDTDLMLDRLELLYQEILSQHRPL